MGLVVRKNYGWSIFTAKCASNTDILMEPQWQTRIGGQWNLDKENRKPPSKGMASPKRLSYKKSAITLEVLNLVRERFHDHFGHTGTVPLSL